MIRQHWNRFLNSLLAEDLPDDEDKGAAPPQPPLPPPPKNRGKGRLLHYGSGTDPQNSDEHEVEPSSEERGAEAAWRSQIKQLRLHRDDTESQAFVAGSLSIVFTIASILWTGIVLMSEHAKTLNLTTPSVRVLVVLVVFSFLLRYISTLLGGRVFQFDAAAQKAQDELEILSHSKGAAKRASRLFRIHQNEIKLYYQEGLAQVRYLLWFGTACIATSIVIVSLTTNKALNTFDDKMNDRNTPTALIGRLEGMWSQSRSGNTAANVGTGSISQTSLGAVQALNILASALAGLLGTVFLGMYKSCLETLNEMHHRQAKTHHLLLANLIGREDGAEISLILAQLAASADAGNTRVSFSNRPSGFEPRPLNNIQPAPGIQQNANQSVGSVGATPKREVH